MQFYKKNKNAIFISILLISSLAVRLYYLPRTPLYSDGAVYAEIIDEFMHNPTLVPYFMNHVISWKPPLGFAVYSLFIYLFNMLRPGVAAEVAYRLPPLIFGVLSTIALYFMARKLYSEDVAFLSSLIFMINPVAIVVSDNLLLETMVSFLLISGMLFYMEGERDKKYMYYAGVAGALLFLTKTIIAFLLPALGIAYYLGSKKIAHDNEMGKSFLISLSGVPLAMLLYALVFQMYAPPGNGADVRVMYIYDLFFRVPGLAYKSPELLSNVVQFLELTLPWSIMFFGGILLLDMRRREDRFVYVWLVLMLVFLGAAQFYSWYYFYALPPFCIVCSRAAMQVKNRKFFMPAMLLLLILSLLAVSNMDSTKSYLTATSTVTDRVEVGNFLRNDVHVMTISEGGLPEVVFYKFHGEQAPNYSAFQMKVLDPSSYESYIAYNTSTEPILGLAKILNLSTASQVTALIANSSSNDYVVMDSGVYDIYSKSPLSDYRIALNSSHGDYVVLKKIT